MNLMTSAEPIPVDEIVDFEKLLKIFEVMISGGDEKRLMFITAPDGRGKTSLLRKMFHHSQSQQVPSCLIDLSYTYDFPHLELAREICERLQLSMTHLTEALSPVSAAAGKVGEKMVASTEIKGNVTDSKIVTQNIIQLALNNETLQRENIKMRLISGIAGDISSADKIIACFFDTIDSATKIVENWLIEALLRPVREGKLTNLIIITAGMRWPRIRDWEWERVANFIEGLPFLSKNHLLEFAERIGSCLSPEQLNFCWEACKKGHPFFMNMIIRNLQGS